MPQKNGKLPGLVKKTQTTQSDMAVTANLSLFCLRKKQKASLTVFSPDECCVCLSNGDIILTFTLTMHIQLQNNCTYGRYCDEKNLWYVSQYLWATGYQKKKKTNTKDSYTRKKKLLFSQEPMVHSTQGRVCCSILVVFVRPFSDKEYTLECEKGLR